MPMDDELTPSEATDTDDEVANLISEAVQLQQQHTRRRPHGARRDETLGTPSQGAPAPPPSQQHKDTGTQIQQPPGAHSGHTSLTAPADLATIATPAIIALPALAAGHTAQAATDIGKVIAPPPVAAKPPTVRRSAGHISMKQLVDTGILKPGQGTLELLYKGTSTTAELTSEGRIQYCGMLFDSPSAFSIYIKRLSNPTRKADDGWKSIRYGGKLLETYKVLYNERQQDLA